MLSTNILFSEWIHILAFTWPLHLKNFLNKHWMFLCINLIFGLLNSCLKLFTLGELTFCCYKELTCKLCNYRVLKFFIVVYFTLFHFYGKQSTVYSLSHKRTGGYHIGYTSQPLSNIIRSQLKNFKVNVLTDFVCWPWRYKSRIVSNARKRLGPNFGHI